MTSTRAFPASKAWLTIIVCALPLLGGCSSEAEPAPEPPRVALVEPLQAAEPKAEALRFSGVVQSVTSTQLSFEVAGRIERILVDEGTRVRRGQPLAQLDRTDYRLQLREAEARLRQLEADLARKRTLLAEGILAPAAIEALQANTVTARVARDSAQRDLDHSTLNAPFDGVVARRLAEPPLTLEDLASEFGVSRERIRQIEVRAFEKLQKAVRDKAEEMKLLPSEEGALLPA